jgi:hypothetical protein
MGRKQSNMRCLKTAILTGLITASMLGSTISPVYAEAASGDAGSTASEVTAGESASEMSTDAANTSEISSAGENSSTGSTEIAAAGEGSVSEDGSEENSVAESSESVESKESKESAQEADSLTDDAESAAAGSMESVATDSTSDELTENAEAVSFKETQELDGISITVSADPGVFPEGCTLQITNASSKEADEAKGAVDEKRPDDVTVAASYVFDISVLNSTGTRIEPDTNAGKVSVSFAAAEAEDKNLDPAVYHVTDDAGELSAEALGTTASGDTLTVQTNGFSLYVVEFTYGDLAYTLKGDSSVLLSDILEAVGLTGEVTDAKSSNPELFTVTTNEKGKLAVNALKAFDTEETLTVTINGTEYQITVTDAQQEEAQTATTSADYNTQTPSPTWEYSKSISATNLEKDADGNYLSNVTISLPSAQEQLATEVCFVLDKSSFSDTQEPALKLLSELKDAIAKNGAKVKVDIVEFNRTAHNHGSYDLATQYDTIVEQFEEQNSGGTNMHAGLLMAKEVLASDASIPDSRKYMILVSDGDSYLYCKNGDYNTPYSRSYIPVGSAGGAHAYGGYYDEGWYCPSAGYTDKETGKTNEKRPTTSDQASWQTYLEDVEARNSESNGDSYDFVWNYYDHFWMLGSADDVAADGFKTQPGVPRSASNLDMGFLNAASAYHDLAAKYHCYAMAAPSWNTADGGHSAFMNYLNNGANTEFESIKNEILYYLAAGSTVEETLGYTADYNFDLFNPEKMTISVDNTEDGSTVSYPAQKIGDNHYGFGPQQDGSYSYEVTYTPGAQDDEKFVWKINVPVTNFMRIHLNYQVKLMNPKTEPGTYGEYDEYGTGHKSSLYVSNRAVLNPVASDGTKGDSEDFEKPTVSYTVQASQAPQPANPASEGGPGSVNLYKVDGRTGAYLAGAVFALYHSDGTYIGTYTTDEKGCIHVDSLGYGTYYFTETKAPAGYVQDPTYIRFVMNETTSKSNAYPWNIRFSNTKSGTATVTVGGTKTWADNNNAAGTRPDAVTLHLLANGTEVGTAVATKENGWAYSFGAQAAVDGNGKAIQYTVTEDAVTGYTASVSAPVTENDKIVINVTNTYTGAKVQAVSTSGSSAAAAGVATGDESHIGVYVTLLLAAAAALAGMILQRRKNQN